MHPQGACFTTDTVTLMAVFATIGVAATTFALCHLSVRIGIGLKAMLRRSTRPS